MSQLSQWKQLNISRAWEVGGGSFPGELELESSCSQKPETSPQLPVRSKVYRAGEMKYGSTDVSMQ